MSNITYIKEIKDPFERKFLQVLEGLKIINNYRKENSSFGIGAYQDQIFIGFDNCTKKLSLEDKISMKELGWIYEEDDDDNFWHFV